MLNLVLGVYGVFSLRVWLLVSNDTLRNRNEIPVLFKNKGLAVIR